MDKVKECKCVCAVEAESREIRFRTHKLHIEDVPSFSKSRHLKDIKYDTEKDHLGTSWRLL